MRLSISPPVSLALCGGGGWRQRLGYYIGLQEELPRQQPSLWATHVLTGQRPTEWPGLFPACESRVSVCEIRSTRHWTERPSSADFYVAGIGWPLPSASPTPECHNGTQFLLVDVEVWLVPDRFVSLSFAYKIPHSNSFSPKAALILPTLLLNFSLSQQCRSHHRSACGFVWLRSTSIILDLQKYMWCYLKLAGRYIYLFFSSGF